MISKLYRMWTIAREDPRGPPIPAIMNNSMRVFRTKKEAEAFLAGSVGWTGKCVTCKIDFQLVD